LDSKPRSGSCKWRFGSFATGPPPSEAEQLMDAVKALHPDEMSPREALEALYALKAKLPKR
jgi:DNA mismatch repair protein MutS